MNLPQVRRKVDQLLASYQHAKRKVKEEKAELVRCRKHVESVVQAQQLLQEVAETIQQSAHHQIAAVVSKCLETVFGENAYQFKINFRKARGKTEAELLFVRDGMEIDPVDASGGGIVDVASFALRFACLLLASPRKRRLILADEPFKHLSHQYRPRVRELLMTLANEFNMQIVFVTHSRELVCGKVIEIE